MFLLVLQLLDISPHCTGCFVGPLMKFDPPETFLLTAGLLLITTAAGLYNDDAAQNFKIVLKRFLMAWLIILVPSVAVIALTKIAAGLPFSGHVGVLSLVITLFMLIMLALHVALGWWLGLSFMKRRVLVLGDGPGAEAVTKFLTGPGCGHFHHLQTIRNWRASECTVPQIGNLLLAIPPPDPAPLSMLAEMLRTDEIIVAVDDHGGLPVAELMECKLHGMEVVDALIFWEREAGVIDSSKVEPGWLTFSSGFVFNHRHRVLKRGLDLMVSMVFLVFALPVCLLTALAIRLESRGPIFYRQERVGLNGRIFSVWKFRSMRTDAELDGVARWAASADDRVTRVGRFIRKLRIDEIPQVINVLVGEMSFIGPRPERPVFVEQLRELIPNYDLRHRMRPGITGWAQVNYPYGASVEDAKQKLSYDLYYLKKNDVLLDFAILVQTIRVVLFPDGAR